MKKYDLTLGSLIEIGTMRYRTDAYITGKFKELAKKMDELRAIAPALIAIKDMLMAIKHPTSSTYKNLVTSVGLDLDGETIQICTHEADLADVVELVLGPLHRRFGMYWELYDKSKDPGFKAIRTPFQVRVYVFDVTGCKFIQKTAAHLATRKVEPEFEIVCDAEDVEEAA